MQKKIHESIFIVCFPENLFQFLNSFLRAFICSYFFLICNYRYQFLQFKISIQMHVLNAYLILLKVNIKNFAD